MDIIRTAKTKRDLYRSVNKKLNSIILEFKDIIANRNISAEGKKIVSDYISKEVRTYFNRVKYIGKRYLQDRNIEIKLVNIDQKVKDWKTEIFLYMKAFLPGEKQINLIEWQLNYIKKKSTQAGVIFRAVFDYYMKDLIKLQKKMQGVTLEKRLSIYDNAELDFYIQKQNKIKYLYTEISKIIVTNIYPFVEVLIKFYKVQGINVDIELSDLEKQFFSNFPLNGITLYSAVESTINIFYRDIEVNLFDGTSLNTSYSKRQGAISKMTENYLYGAFQYAHEKFAAEFKL